MSDSFYTGGGGGGATTAAAAGAVAFVTVALSYRYRSGY